MGDLREIVAAVSDLTQLRDRMRTFTDQRDWNKFHDPKSLLLALVGEVGELAELFQWLPANDAKPWLRNSRFDHEPGKSWPTS